MIRESLYFSYDGMKSTEFPIANVSVTDGAFQESVSSGKVINETYPREAFKPYFFGTQKNVKQFDLSFAFLEPWNDDMIDRIIQWLNVDDYKPLFFEADIDKVFYAMPISDIQHTHVGLKEGYLTMTFRCDSAYSYSHEIYTPWYNARENNTIEIINRGHYPLLPEIWIENFGSFSPSITNNSDEAKRMRFSNIGIGEMLYIDCANEIIETSEEGIHRYDDFNDEYLELVYGRNILTIAQDTRVRFRYQYIFS